jgi:hypothetical protein
MNNSKEFSSVSATNRVTGYGRLALLACAIALSLAACTAGNDLQHTAWQTRGYGTVPGVFGGL